MYYLLIFILFVLSECKWPNPSGYFGFSYGHGLGYKKPGKPFCCIEDVRDNMVVNLKAADEIVRQYCTENYNAREVFDAEGYRLVYTFKNNIEDLTSVKLNSRVVYVQVKLSANVEANDMRLLPRGLKTREAVWRMDGKDLILTIPYESKSDIEIPMACNYDLDDTIMSAPLSPEYKVQSLFKHFPVTQLVEVR